MEKKNQFDKKSEKMMKEVESGKHPEIASCLVRLDEIRKKMVENQESMVMIMAIADAFRMVIEDAQKNKKIINSFAYFELVMSSLVKLELDGVIEIKIK